ncbi:MAG: ABC transporter permease [Thermoplasmata archaeon]
MTPRWLTAAATLPLLAFLVAFVLLPVSGVVASAFPAAASLSGWATLFADPLNRDALWNSLVQGGLSAGASALVGYPVGVFLGRYDWPGRRLMRSLLLLPFLLPSLLVVLGIADLFGPGGLLLGGAPGLGFFGRGVGGIVAVNVAFNAPMVALFTAVGAESASGALEESLASLGARPGRVYREVWGPPSWWGALAGALLAFLFSALAFAAPLLLAGPAQYTLEDRIWSLDQILLNTGGAAMLATVTLAFLAVPTAAYLMLLPRLAPTGSRAAPRLRRRNLSPVAGLLAGITAAFAAGELLLVGAVLDRTIAPAGGRSWGASWSLLFGPETTRSLGLSIPEATVNTLAFAGAAAAIALGLALGFVFARSLRPRTPSLLPALTLLPLLISPIMLAFALASVWEPILGGPREAWILIVVSQATLGLPFVVQSLSVPLAGLSAAPREAARTLGAGPWTAFTDVDLPRLRSGLTVAGLFAFAFGLGEFTATYFLVTPSFTTLTVAVYRLQGVRLPGVADAAAGLLLVVSAAAIALLALGGARVRY